MRTVINLFKILVLRSIFKSKIDFSSYVHLSARLYSTLIKRCTYIGPNCVINDANIGNYCSIGPNVVIGGMEHDYRQMSTSTHLSAPLGRSKTIIEDDVWIGAGSFIRAGVILGKGAVIGSNSTVLANVEPMAIVVGSPANFKKYRFESEFDKCRYMKVDFNIEKQKLLRILKNK